MSTNTKKRDIYDRIDTLAIDCLNFARTLPRTVEYSVIVKQLIRSATSIGANAQEADGSESKAEFIHRWSISKKEAKETAYWLSLLSKYNEQISVGIILTELNEIIAIISKIIINTKNK